MTWEQVDLSALGQYFEPPLFDPRSPDTVYARVVLQEGDDYSMVGVFRSTDGGITWKNIVDELVADDTESDPLHQSGRRDSICHFASRPVQVGAQGLEAGGHGHRPSQAGAAGRRHVPRPLY